MPITRQNIRGNAATAGQLQTTRTIGGVAFNGSASIDLPGVNQQGNQNTTGSAARVLLGADSTAGTPDWNHVSNTAAGHGPKLLLGSEANGPGGDTYFHVLNFEYSAKNGTGQVTQLAISYAAPANEIFMRGRYENVWTSWTRFANGANLAAGFLATLRPGGVGTYAMLRPTINAAGIAQGTTLPGSQLQFSDCAGASAGAFAGGAGTTWMLFGQITANTGPGSVSLWLRIS
jgi:hypothetical protein